MERPDQQVEKLDAQNDQPEKEEQGASGKSPDDILALFEEEAESNDDVGALTAALEDVDIYKLVEECREIAQRLGKGQ